jgi:hypothetical protein
MRENAMKLDAGQAWTDAMAMLNGQREILLTVTGCFIMLPALFLNALRPFAPARDRGALFQELMVWMNVNFHWVVLVAVLAALGRLTILILLLQPARPTVGEALAAGARLLLIFVVMDLLIGFMLLGGLFLFVLPACYIFGRTFVAEAGFAAERLRGPVAGVARSLAITKGNGWRIFGVSAVIYVAGVILTAAVGSVVGVLVALFGGSGLDRVLNALVEAGLGAGVSLVMVLVSVAIYRQLADDRDVRGGIAR